MVGMRATSVFFTALLPSSLLRVSVSFLSEETKGSTAASSSEPQTSELYTGWYPSPTQRHRRTYAECVSTAAPPTSIRGGGNATRRSATTRPVSRGGNGGCVSGAAANISNPAGAAAVGLSRLSRRGAEGGVAVARRASSKALSLPSRREENDPKEKEKPPGVSPSSLFLATKGKARAGFRVNA